MSADRPAGPGFAGLLRQRRRAARLTQVELADLAGLAVRTVRDAERGRTTRPQRSTAQLLADALGLQGVERAEFLAAARGEVRPSEPLPGSGPAPPPLFGRGDELAALAELVTLGATDGPVSLVGLAGVGKTGLALAVAHRVAGEFPAGVLLLPVGRGATTGELLGRVASRFGRPGGGGPATTPPAVPPTALSSAPDGLLVLDGIEQAPGEVRGVLARLPPTLQVITTGRVPAGLSAERVWPVTPLPPPPAAGDAPAEVVTNPAVALFLDRLARVRPEPPAADELPALVGLVRRVGGLPLALEMLAGQARLLRLPQLLRRYGHRVLDLHTRGAGVRTLRQAVAASYQWLTPPAQAAVRWLATFRGGWSVELAEQVLGAAGVAGDPLPLLDELVGRGLVEVSGAGEYRFRLLSLVREFGVEQAARRGELARVRRAHALAVADLVGRVAPFADPGLPAAARLDEVAGEVWAALSHAANHQPATALTLAARLPRWWRRQGREATGRQWLRRLLADPRAAPAGPAVRAWALTGLAQLAYEQGEGPAERPAAETALAEFRRLRDVTGQVAAARVLAAVCLAAGGYDQAREHTLAAVALAVTHGRPGEAALGQLDLVWHELRTGDLVGAARRLAVVDRLAVQAGDPGLRASAAAGGAEVARLAGRYEAAVATGQRVLAGLGWPLGAESPVGRERSPDAEPLAGPGRPGVALPDVGGHWRVLATVGQALAALGRSAEAERVLARLRAEEGPEARPALAGMCALIEARLALARGDRVLAAEWFSAAVAACRGGEDRRRLVEALVELAACAEPGERRRARAELTRVCREGGFGLLPRERALLSAARGRAGG